MTDQIFLPFISAQKSIFQLSIELVTYWMNEPRQMRPNMQIDVCLMDFAEWKARDIVDHSLHPGHRASNGEMPNDSLRRLHCWIPDWYSEGDPVDDDMGGNNVESLGYNYGSLPDLFEAIWNSPKHQAHVYATDLFFRPQARLGACHYVNAHPVQGEWLRIYVLVSAPLEEE